jgi:hypothetical protein
MACNRDIFTLLTHNSSPVLLSSSPGIYSPVSDNSLTNNNVLQTTNLLVSDAVKVIKREEQNQIKAAEIMLPLVSLIHAVAVFQVFGKCRCNVTPHNAQ